MATTQDFFEPRRKYLRAFATEEDVRVAEAVREFVDREVMPARHDLEGGWHRDEAKGLATVHRLYREAWTMGLPLMGLPTQYGGAGASPAARIAVNVELSRGDVGLANMVAKMWWATSILLAGRRDDLLQELAGRFRDGAAWTTAVCITEPQGGCNIEDPAFAFRTIRTRARREDDAWVLSGHKIWPGPGGPPERFRSRWLAGHIGYFVVATTDPRQGPEGVGLFYVPAETPGLRFSSPYAKMGQSWTDENVEIWLEDVRIPERYRVDRTPGEGWKILKGQVIAFGRLASAASLVGVAEACLEIALDWTSHRSIAGIPVRNRSAFAMMLGEMARDIDVARQYTFAVLWQATQRGELRELYGRAHDPSVVALTSMARSFAGETAQRVAHRAMELMGAYGYSYDHHVEKYLRDLEIVRLWLGGPHRDRLDVAQALYGLFPWPGQTDEDGGASS